MDARLEDHPEQPVVQWTMWPVVRKPFCFRVPSETAAFSPESVTDGYTRPYGSPHLWASEPVAAGEEAWLELCWPSAVSLQDIHLTIYDDLNEDLINLHHRTPFEVIPELVWDYRIEACLEGGWQTLHREEGNRKRKRVHHFEAPVTTNRLRLCVEAANGCSRVEAVEVRVYGE